MNRTYRTHVVVERIRKRFAIGMPPDLPRLHAIYHALPKSERDLFDDVPDCYCAVWSRVDPKGFRAWLEECDAA